MTAPLAPTFEPPVPNLPLLRKVLDHIDAHPEEWRQSTYATVTDCGTAHCIAGHAVAMTVGVTRDQNGVLSPAPAFVTFHDEGMHQLGLTEDEAQDLFVNTLDGEDMVTIRDCPEVSVREAVQRVAEAIAARSGERL